MDPSKQLLVQVVNTLLVVLAFGPFAVGLYFLVRPLQEGPRRRWQVPHLLCSLGWGVGMLLAFLSRGVMATLTGAALILVCTFVECRLLRD